MNTPNTDRGSSEYSSPDRAESHQPEALIRYANSNDLRGFETTMITLKGYEIFKVADKKLYTLLHIVCLNNNEEIFNLLANYIKKENEEKSDFKEMFTKYIDQKTNEGYAAIHFASYKGNLKILTTLESLGANLNITNNFGLNVLHIAAQGDAPLSLYFFKKRGFNINQKDTKGSSPLHWATFRGSENAVNYLTSWNCEINKPDKEGNYTPLHLAVIASNMKIVRRLLQKGADKNMLDKNFKKPIDIAKDNDLHSIYNLLDKKSSFYDLCDMTKSNSKMKRKRALGVLMFLTILLLFYVANVFIYFPYIDNVIEIILVVVCFFSSTTFFMFCWLKNPGYLKNNSFLRKKTNFLELLSKYDPSCLCPECEIFKPKRSRHCEICDTCVQVYDHHCPWINNCVGAKNHRYFLGFLASVVLTLLNELVLIGININKKHPSYYYIFEYSISDYNLFWVKILLSVFMILTSLFFFFPLLYLFYVHCTNFALNKTTLERYGYHAKKEVVDQMDNSRKTSSESNINHGEFSQKIQLLQNTYKRSDDPSEIKMVHTESEEKNNNGVIYNCMSMCYENEMNAGYIYGSQIEPHN